MDWYLSWVSASPLQSAAVQFGILGTLGELISHVLKTRRIGLPCSLLQLAGRILAWAVLGIVIKYGFTGMKGFVAALNEHNLLPAACMDGLGWAFAVSVFTNVLFGPQMMLFHRVEENLIARRWTLEGMPRAWFTLIWFWIPAHTVTFSLPKDYQIGLAALWSVALGLIMGLTAPKPIAKS
ncbi:hypothetical protein EHM69_00890 [candidate division KSB1 bacterium]|nr:MAG: hypothetical protein EHM69_00890 [candidate division KSB1 bacterium]